MAVDVTLNNEEDDDDIDPQSDSGATSPSPNIAPQPTLKGSSNPLPSKLPGAKYLPDDPSVVTPAELSALQSLKSRLQRERRRAHQDETRERSREQQNDKLAASARRQAIRGDAVTQRIQAYTIASSMGFAGYVMASLVDQFVIRPAEDKAIKAEIEYTSQYRKYFQAEQDDQLGRNRSEEDFIRSLKKEDLHLDYDQVVELAGGGTARRYQPAFDKAGYDAAVAAHKANPRDAKGRFTKAPKEEDFYDSVPEFGAGRTYYGTQGGSGAVGSGGPGMPSAASLASGAAALKPVIPTAAATALSTAGAPLMAAAVVAQVLQSVNKTIDASGKAISETNKQLLLGTPQEGLRSGARLAKNAYDPLGINTTAQVVVTGFDTLLSLTEDIRKYSEKNLEFSPSALMADVEGQNELLLQSIQQGMNNDPIKAEVIRASNQLDLIWRDFQAKLFESMGPTIVTTLNVISTTLQGLVALQSGAKSFWNGTAWGYLRLQIDKLITNTTPDKDDGAGLHQEIADFLDPKSHPMNPGHIPRAGKQPKQKP